MNENKNRATFQSRLGFILVSAGCAIGLGNVWKFPYICGQNGGGAFLFLYLICLVLLGLPILICEFAIGRGSNRSLSQAFNRLEKPGSRYHCTKYTSIAGNYLLMMFYTMVTGWMLYYAFKYATGSLDASSTAATAEAFKDMQASPWLMLIFSAIVIILCIGVCALGLQNGIEKVTKIMITAAWSNALRDFGPKYMNPEFYDKVIIPDDVSDGIKLKEDEVNAKYVTTDKNTGMPVVQYTEDELSRITAIGTDVYSYVESMYAHWVVDGGVEDEWDSYIEQLNAMGLEELVSLQQGAYAAYLESME